MDIPTSETKFKGEVIAMDKQDIALLRQEDSHAECVHQETRL